jgi:hypothetical protein
LELASVGALLSSAAAVSHLRTFADINALSKQFIIQNNSFVATHTLTLYDRDKIVVAHYWQSHAPPLSHAIDKSLESYILFSDEQSHTSSVGAKNNDIKTLNDSTTNIQ